jgi:glycosyltransferase involved in cell wall biosynthesis
MYFTYPETHLHTAEESAMMVRHARQCLAIITCSENSKRDIAHYTGVRPEKISVIPWGFNPKVFYPEENPSALRQRLREQTDIENPYFLSVSCDIGRKRSDVLLEQYAKLLRHHPANDLVLVWRTPPDRIKIITENIRPAGRVHVINTVTDQELRDLYCGATAMFYPSVYEGFGLPVLEAMACGTPVVTTRAASLPEVAGEAALYVSTENNDELFYAMEQFENHAIDRQSIAEKSLKQASLFSWRRCADQTIQVYRECLGI